jgi:hypothetical protein
VPGGRIRGKRGYGTETTVPLSEAEINATDDLCREEIRPPASALRDAQPDPRLWRRLGAQGSRPWSSGCNLPVLVQANGQLTLAKSKISAKTCNLLKNLSGGEAIYATSDTPFSVSSEKRFMTVNEAFK